MNKGLSPVLLGERSVALLRGRRGGLEVTLSAGDLAQGFAELHARLTEQPGFYRGAGAIVNFGSDCPSDEELARLRGVLDEAGIALRGVAGFDEELAALAARSGLAFEAPREQTIRPRALRPRTDPALSESARSLVADFAGARGDIAQRRRRGEASVRRQSGPPVETPRPPAALHVVETGPATLYHASTLRGGQVLHHNGNIVVVGDVNPGAELIATGDILVFGRLGGIAHAGAQGDESARIYALDLSPTQLRIATFIAADAESKRSRPAVAEAALVRDGRITILTLDRLDMSGTLGAVST
ncbi:MAG TPA: septum site-determining protein MinC [Candidatus Cybelea sp.]